MSKEMRESKLSPEYLDYVRSGEARAVAFVRRHLNAAKSWNWISVSEFHEIRQRDDVERKPGEYFFKYIVCELFPKKTAPVYPPRSRFADEASWAECCRQATWEAANHDIDTQRAAGYVGPKFAIHGRLVRDDDTGERMFRVTGVKCLGR